MEFAGTTRAVENRTRRKGVIAESSVMSQSLCNAMRKKSPTALFN